MTTTQKIAPEPSLAPRKKPSTSFVDMTTDRDEARNVYDAWAKNYEKDIRKWGYDMPERVAALLPNYLDPADQATVLLDTGCGDGLSGVALQNAGYSTILASDLSPEMLQVAEQRKCYVQTDVVDLSEKSQLPYETNTFDAVTCIGTLTYVNPKAKTLAEFVRVTKPGGFVCYTHRTDKADLWKLTEQELETTGQWELIEAIGPLPYLPENPDYGDKVEVMIYLFRVTK